MSAQLDPRGAPGSSAPAVLTARPVQLRGSRLARGLLRLIGWRIAFDGLPARQGVIVVYPHTSNWDFPVGLLVKWAIGLPAHFWAKHSLFRLPLVGRWMRHVGGIPIDRSAAQGVVQQTVRELREAAARDALYWVVLAPEGTRSWRPHWRSGFYHLALQAQVPLGIVAFDWGRRELRFVDFLRLGGEPQTDLATIAAALDGVRGRRPAQAAPIRFD